MSRKNKRAKRAKEREQVALTAKVRLDGSGEDPIVKLFLKELATANHQRAFEIMSAMQAHIRGEPFDLADPELRAQVAKHRERLAKKDKAELAAGEDPVKFVEDVMQQSRKLHPTAADLAKDQALGAQMYARARDLARANAAQKCLYYMGRIKNDPKELFFVRGSWETDGEGQTRQLPEVVHLDGLDGPIVAKPGQRELPRIVCEILRQRYRDQDAASAREATFADNKGAFQTRKKLREIDREYGETTQTLPMPAVAVI